MSEPAASSAHALATALVEAERRLIAEQPATVVIHGDDDDALATALAAAKLLIPIELAADVPEPADPAQETNRRLIALLAG